MNNNLKKNVVMGIINAIFNNLVPVVSFVYVARILSVDGLGINQFAHSLVNYFMLFAMLGIPLYATKRISKLRDDEQTFKKECSEIFWLNIISGIIVSVFYLAFVFMTDKTSLNWVICCIYGCMILGSVLSVEWYYQGTERFTYITIRNIIVKTITIICLFIFVRDSNDFIIYATIMTLSTVLYSLINVSKFVLEVKPSIKSITVWRHFKPVMMVFALQIVISVYVYLDNIMLGYMMGAEGDYMVGQYSVAVKIPRLIITLITTLNTILLPRLSYYYSKKDQVNVDNLLSKSFSIIFAASSAATVGLILTCDKIVPLLCGQQYSECVATVKLMSVTIFFVCLTNLIGIQIFYNINKTWKTILSCAVGGIIDFIINLILIPGYGYWGAAIGTVCAEMSVFIVQIILGRRDLTFKVFTRDFFVALASSVIMGVIVYLTSLVIDVSLLVDTLVLVAIGLVSFAGLLWILGHSYYKATIKQIVNKVFKKRG